MSDYFKNITIVGMGLMGGSLGKFLVSQNKEITVTALVRRDNAIDHVLSHKAAHKCTTDIYDGIKDADLVIISTPVEIICEYGKRILPYLKRNVVVTDMGSTKDKIVKSMTVAIGEKAVFIGSHPMAGSEKTGLENSYPELFLNSLCVLTPLEESPVYLVEKLKLFWENVGCRVMQLPPDIHDYLISSISHVPHIVAAVLVNFASKIRSDIFSSLDFASSGFRDTTRIASGSPEMWNDICSSNSINIASQLEIVENMIHKIRNAIQNGDNDQVLKFLCESKNIRDLLIKNCEYKNE